MTRFPLALIPPSAPVFFATAKDGRVGVAGDPVCPLGHKVETGARSGEGIFAEWDWNGQRLAARNDRYGFYPLFLFHKENQVGISASIAALVRHGADTTLDYPGLAVALRLGQFVGDDTPFHYIRALPPNARLQWDGKQLKLSGGYEFHPSVHSTRDEAIQTYLELFRRSIQRRPPPTEKFSVPLSGGRDSRHILFELVRNGFRPAYCLTAMTFPDDVRTAALVCQHLGLEHVIVEQPSAPYLAEVRKNWITNFGVDEGAYPIAISEALMHRGVTAIYDGIAGDVLSAGLFLERPLHDLFKNGRRREIAEHIIPPGDEPALKRILARDFLDRCSRQLALERLGIEVAKHFGAHNPVTSFFFWNRTRRKIALTPYAMLSTVPYVFSPYLDHDLFDFLASLPAELLMDHSFHTNAIVHGFPQWSHIPFENKSAKPYDFSAMYARFAREFAEHALLHCPRNLLRTHSLCARLILSLLSGSFGASQQWYLRRAAWLYQLGILIGDEQETRPAPRAIRSSNG
jgi:asparagine synthase (glutamine-hydrolysing)